MSDPLDELEQVLTRERQAIAAGDLDRIADCGSEKAEALARLAEAPPLEARRLATLTVRLERNQTLLQASLAGVRAAVDRIVAIRSVRRSLTTYDAKGRASDLSPPSAGLERKA